MGVGLREYMEMEEPDPSEPEEFYAPCASYGGRAEMKRRARISRTKQRKEYAASSEQIEGIE